MNSAVPGAPDTSTNSRVHGRPEASPPLGEKRTLVAMEPPRIHALAGLLELTPPQLQRLLDEVHRSGEMARICMQMFYVFLLNNQHEAAVDMQTLALQHQRCYRIHTGRTPTLRLLVLMGPGHMQANTPIELVLHHCAVQTDILYLLPGEAFPEQLPPHDLVFVAIGESDTNAPLLARLHTEQSRWPKPIVNRPGAIPNCARDACYQLLKDIPGVRVPRTQRIFPGEVPDMGYPLTLRPVDTHGGEGLERIASAEALPAYYARYPAAAYYAAPYVDYQSADGLFRKLRIVLIDGQPYICHLAISSHWMVHYLSAGMGDSADKRREEQQVMQDFEQGFALQFGAQLAAIAHALQLDYVTVDCAQTPDGQLLVFEVDSRGLVHAADPVELYPYKPAVMQKAFDAFEALLHKRAARVS